MTKKTLLLLIILLTTTFVSACGSKDPSEGEKKPGTNTTTCNNGKIDKGEECDGTDLNGKTCASIDPNKPEGTLSCSSTCKLVTTACKAPTCNNNGKKDGTEECDGTDFGGKTCATIDPNKPLGNLTCNACKIDTSGCTAPPSACTEKANFYGQFKSASKLTTTAPTVDAGLTAIKDIFDKAPTDWTEDEEDLVYTFTTPQEITGAIIAAIPYKTTSELYVQDQSGTYKIRGSQDMIPIVADRKVGKTISFKISKLRIYKGKTDTTHSQPQIDTITDITYGADAPVYYSQYSATTVPYSIVQVAGTLSDKKACPKNYGCFTLTDASNNKVILRVSDKKNLNNGDCVTYLGPFTLYGTTRQLKVIDFDTVTK